MAKKYTQSQLSGARGENFVAERFNAMGHVFQQSGGVEAGIDGYVEVRDPETEEATGQILGVQTKTRTGRFTAETDTSFEYLVDESDLAYWLKGNLPIVLVVARPNTGEAYFKSIKDYFDTVERRKKRRILFDKEADRLDVETSPQIVDLARPKDSGLYMSPPREEEELISNLLPVRRFADTIYHAETDYHDPGRLWSDAKDKNAKLSGEWILKSGRIWSLHNLREEPYRQFCSPETTEDDDFSHWASATERDLKMDFVRLLKQCLRERLRRTRVGYNKDPELFYFWSTKDLSDKKVNYLRHTGNTSYQTVFKKYPEESDEVHYYRHFAFHPFFWRIGGQWYLRIEPTYLFTTNGYEIHLGNGKLNQNIKRYEGHEDVRTKVEFWAHQLRRTDFVSEYAHLSFGPLLKPKIDRGIDDELWQASGSTEAREAPPARSDSAQYTLFESVEADE